MVSGVVKLSVFTVALAVFIVYPLPGSSPGVMPLPPNPDTVLAGKPFKLESSNDIFTKKVFYIDSHGEKLHSWAFLPKNKKADKAPVVVMAHGLGCIKQFGIEKYASDFAKAGYVVVAFDYRGFSHSTGTPRNFINWNILIEDWESVLDYVVANAGGAVLEFADAGRIGLWGSSYSGGHVVTVSALTKHKIKAAVSQVPYVGDLITPLLPKDVESLRNTLMGTFTALQDALRTLIGLPSLYVNVFGRPGETGILKRNDPVLEDWIGSADKYWINETPARSLLYMLTYNPSGYVKPDHKVPTLFVIQDGDTICPSKAIDDLAAKFPQNSKTLHHVGTHFEVYDDKKYRHELTAKEIEFFNEKV